MSKKLPNQPFKTTVVPPRSSENENGSLPKNFFSQPTCRVDVQSRTIYIHGEIEETLAAEVAEKIDILDEGKSPIYVEINSCGGDAYAGVSVCSKLMSAECPVHVDVSGVAMSAAAWIALCGDHIRMSKYGIMMLHFPRWATPEGTNVYEHKLDAAVTEEMFDRLFKDLLKDSKLTFQKYKKESKEDFYITPTEALKYGLIHEIY